MKDMINDHTCAVNPSVTMASENIFEFSIFVYYHFIYSVAILVYWSVVC